MLTLNYKRWVNEVQVQNTGSGDFTPSGFIKEDGTAASVAGDARNRIWNFNFTKAYSSNLEQYSNIYVGTGNTTPETETNVTLDSILTTNITDVSGTASVDSSTGKLTITKTFSYSGSSDVEIKEIGLYKGVWNSGQPILMAREVLETPITVSNGDSFVVSMTIG